MYVYNEGDQLTSETTGGTTTTYEYDPNGALTKSDDGTTANGYTYDYDGYLAAFDTTGTANDAVYLYDGDKRRIAKTVDETTIEFFLDGADVIADYDGDDVLVATYVTPGLDANLSVTRSGSTYYYLKDGLGSIRNLVDSNETTQNMYDYYAFGKALGDWTENVTNRYTYTAREWDEESEQYYYRARYYGGTGRFQSRDPLRRDVSLNLYSYVNACPLNRIDPRGAAFTEKRVQTTPFEAVDPATRVTGVALGFTKYPVETVRPPVIDGRWIVPNPRMPYCRVYKCWVRVGTGTFDMFVEWGASKQGIHDRAGDYTDAKTGKTVPNYKYYVKNKAATYTEDHEQTHVLIWQALFNARMAAAETNTRRYWGETNGIFGANEAHCEEKLNIATTWSESLDWHEAWKPYYKMLQDVYDKQEQAIAPVKLDEDKTLGGGTFHVEYVFDAPDYK